MSRQVKRISDLPEAGPIQGDELLEMVQGGENVRVRADQLGGTELPIEMTDVTGLPEALDERVLDDDPRLSDARVPTGVAGGVLSGQYPNPGFAVPMATAAQLDGKVDKVEGKGLSTNDLTDPLYDKLVGLEGTHWRGTFVSLAALEAGVTDPQAGDYADVDVVGEDVRRYIWDATDSTWVAQSGEVAPLTAAQVKLLYESNPDTNAFTDADEAKLDSVKEWATAETQDAAQTALGFSVSGKSVATGTPAQGRAGLGLGTAATADVTTTATDPISGRVMKVGDFGIGSDLAIPYPHSSLDNIDGVRSGIYRATGEAGVPNTSILLHLSYSPSNVIQYAFEHTHLQRIWHRVYYGDSWTDWGVVYDKDFVSQQTGTYTSKVMSQKAVTDALETKAGTSIATQSANGLMSSTDKQKSDYGIVPLVPNINSSRTLDTNHLGKIIYTSGDTPITLTLPSEVPEGSTIIFFCNGGGRLTLAGTSLRIPEGKVAQNRTHRSTIAAHYHANGWAIMGDLKDA